MARTRLRDAPGALKVDFELAHWRRLAHRPRLWWRDDDAQAPSPALDRLLDLASGRPLALAVIPQGDLAPLATRLTGEPNITIGQHGVDHTNRRRPGEPPSEYPADPPVDELAARIGEGADRLSRAGLIPHFYTPPWNVLNPELADALRQTRTPTLSAGRARIGVDPATYLSTDVDVLSWKSGARFKGSWRILSRLAGALAERRLVGVFERPIGLLTHHLDHDPATWRFLEWLAPYLDQRFDWVRVTAPNTASPPECACPPTCPSGAMAEMQHV